MADDGCYKKIDGRCLYLIILLNLSRLSEIRKRKTISNRGWAISRRFILLFIKVFTNSVQNSLPSMKEGTTNL